MTLPNSTHYPDETPDPNRARPPGLLLLRAIFPELEAPMAHPLATFRAIAEARTEFGNYLAKPRPRTFPIDLLLAERLEVHQHVELLYASLAGDLQFETAPNHLQSAETPASRDPIVSALRRVHGLPGLPPLDPAAAVVLQRQSGTPLWLYRLALEEARLLDQTLDLPLHLDLMGLHLEDPAPVARTMARPDAWALVEYKFVVYRGIHRAQCDDIEGTNLACAWVAEQRTPSNPLLLSVVAELKARAALFHGSTADIVQPLIMSSIVLQDEPSLYPRLVELAVLRLEIHEERGESALAAKTRRWLRTLAYRLDRQAFPPLAARVDRALGIPPKADRRPTGMPILE